MNIPKSHLLSEDDLPLMQVSYTWALASVWLENGMESKWATFDLFVRELPIHRNFLLAGGLEEIITFIKKLTFSDEQIEYLFKKKLITNKCADYLRKFKFSGDIYAMPEGTVFFGYEPIIRISAPIVEAAIIEQWIITSAMSNTIFLSKAIRMVIAADNKFTIATGPLRGHSLESSFKATRAAELCGMVAPATPSFSMKYNLKVDDYWINSQHLFVTSFPTELQAFRALAKMYPNNCGFLIDTYDPIKGIENAIMVAKELRLDGKSLKSIYIDSGNKVKLVKYARKRLKEENLNGISITVAGGMNEHSIQKFASMNLEINTISAIEELMTVNDSPKLDLVYKLSELVDENSVLYTAKLTPGKLSYPGKKQVFRVYKDGQMDHDIVGLENEKLGEPLLKKIVDKGNVVYDFPNWENIRTYIKKQVNSLPSKLKKLRKNSKHEISFSSKLQSMLEQIRQEKRGS